MAGASRAESQNGMNYATRFLSDKQNLMCPITVLSEDKANKDTIFQSYFAL